MRQRLIELCENLILSCKASLCEDCEHNEDCEYNNVDYPHCISVHYADHLLANGVIVPPCKVGGTVYYISTKYEKVGRKKVYVDFVDAGVVDSIIVGEKGVPQINVCNDDNVWMFFDADKDFGRVAFLSKEEAEQALKGGGD